MIGLKKVNAPKRASIKKVISPLVGKVICVSGLMVTYLMPDGGMETICLM